MASEIRVDKINSLSGVGTVTLSPTGVDIAGITTAATLRATTGIVTSLTAGSLTSLGAVSGTTGTFSGDVTTSGGDLTVTGANPIIHLTDTDDNSDFQLNVNGGIFQVYDYSNTAGRLLIASDGTVTVAQDLAIADKIIHTGDTNTALRFPAADTITAETSGAEAIRINNSGQFLVGVTAARTMLSGYTPSLQVEGTANSDSSVSIVENISAASGPSLWFGKTRGSSLSANTVVQSGDELGTIVFNGADGTDVQSMGAFIRASVDGTPGSNDMPGRITIHTTADGAASPTERVRIDSSGNMGLGTNSPASLFHMSGASPRITLTDTNGTDDVGKIFSYAGALMLQQRDGNSHGEIIFRTENNSTAVERMRIKNDGDVSIADGNLVIGTAGHGIDFSAAPHVGGMASELLDDYEEGTFTVEMSPVTSGSISMTTVLDSLRYTKIGNLVTIHGRVRIESKNNPVGGLTMSGLPYASIGSNTNSQDGYQHFAVNTHGVNFDNNTVQIFGEMSPNATSVGFFSMYDNANWAMMDAALIQGNQNEYFGFSFFYHTAT